ncbi:hypothetical protein CB1_000472007 [Camelus ferus]|nr:hypothetical protein CB1_000472007 [Camelus ferus]
MITLGPDMPVWRLCALQESLNQNFMLIITHRELQREYNLNFSGSSTIQELVEYLEGDSGGQDALMLQPCKPQ